ncbi:MAG: argininosuccinate synthase [Elusimicrobia bacterium]|nr:argininosuccinate synthase [Elusimicrobiota bacterium]
MKKIVLAYSGGLDTTCLIPWLKENYKADVVAYCALLGESEDVEELKNRAKQAGADDFHFKDLTEEFIEDYAFPALRVGAVYEDTYLLATALARPLIVKWQVKVAEETGADAVAHGCTGKGNDQVRFEVAAMTLNPKLKNLAPVREWEFTSRADELEYLKKKGLTIKDKGGGKYSIDRNIWGISVECGALEDPWTAPPRDTYIIVNPIEEAPDTAEEVIVEFEKGVPVKVNGEKLSPVDLVKKLNTIAGKHGVGRVDMVENRVVGIKSREVYEFPAARVLFNAIRALEALVLEKEFILNKRKLAMEYARLVYEGKWFSPLRESIQNFADTTANRLTGEVRVKLYKGNAVVTGTRSPYSMYVEELATYTDKDTFSHKDAEGFINLWGLPYKVWGSVKDDS